MQHGATFALLASAATRRKLDDHTRAMLAHTFLYKRVFVRVGTWRLILIANMDVNQRCASLEGFMRRFDLLGRGDRDSGSIGFSRQRAGYGDSDDARC